ncbi:hypothetical protein AVEN_55747-1 [Araneus ventricosus]|uniref:Uncharacterized protein n=1 Tax=Araneus ventricosus TaxID=182803 RepID=A0A4Y2JY54_ARAVE|nr:hypothetical protein AVEN_55747-1 [Araneus ventricosus]
MYHCGISFSCVGNPKIPRRFIVQNSDKRGMFDVGIKYLQKQETVRYDPLIINHHYQIHFTELLFVHRLLTSFVGTTLDNHPCEIPFLDEIDSDTFYRKSFFNA